MTGPLLLSFGEASRHAETNHADALRAAGGPFRAWCEAFEALPDSTVFAFVGAVCMLVLLADLTDRYLQGRRR